MTFKTAITIGLIIIMTAAAVPSVCAEATHPKWYRFGEGVALGNRQGKKVFIYFWAEWCTYCHTMEKETLQNPKVLRKLAEEFIAVKVNTDKEKELSDKFKIRGLPDNWFMAENGDIVGHRPGYIPADVFIKILESVAGNEPESR